MGDNDARKKEIRIKKKQDEDEQKKLTAKIRQDVARRLANTKAVANKKKHEVNKCKVKLNELEKKGADVDRLKQAKQTEFARKIDQAKKDHDAVQGKLQTCSKNRQQR